MNILFVDLTLVKAVFVVFLIVFCLFSFFVDLPPGIWVTNTLDFAFPYFYLLSNNLVNGLFFGSIIGLGVFVAKRKTRTKISKRVPLEKSSFDYEAKDLLSKDQKFETESSLTVIKGIGPKRALDLEFAGVKTISDLAKRSPKHLAKKTGIPITQISKWIIEANKQLE